VQLTVKTSPHYFYASAIDKRIKILVRFHTKQERNAWVEEDPDVRWKLTNTKFFQAVQEMGVYTYDDGKLSWRPS